ncbi:hypothetical protein CKOHBEJN_01021 [Aeromonas hydrophila]
MCFGNNFATRLIVCNKAADTCQYQWMVVGKNDLERHR